MPGSAARCSWRGRAATAPPGAGRMPHRSPAARSTPGRSARPTPRRTARPSGRRCSSRSRARLTAGSARTEHPPTRTPTTTPRAARDALHFAALFDRFIQNLRRYTGYDLQYFAAIEPQRRLAPHIHLAIRGTISRAELREVIAATYHQVWWPVTDVKYDGEHLPVWDEHTGTYLDPDTGEVLPTWDQALDAIGDQDEPRHVARFGARFDAQGVLAGSRDASRCIGYLTKYLTKHLGDCHQAATDTQADARRPARRRAAVRAVLADLRELAPLRHPAQERHGPACGPGPAKAKPTAANTSATPDAASWSPANGPARP